MSELYYDRIVIIPIFLLPFVLLLNGIITSWYYYRMFVIRNSTITKYIQYRMNYYWMTPLPISTITKVFHPRIVPIPNATITELRITELFYYGLLLPNVAHSNFEIQAGEDVDVSPWPDKDEKSRIPNPCLKRIQNLVNIFGIKSSEVSLNRNLEQLFFILILNLEPLGNPL